MRNNNLQYISPDAEGLPSWNVRLSPGCGACQAAAIAAQLQPPELCGTKQRVVGKPRVELRSDGFYWARLRLVPDGD